MKKKLLILLTLTLLFAVFILVKFFILSKKETYGELQILSSPAANVFLDDLMIGKTPLKTDKIKVGTHTLKLIPEGDSKESATWKGNIKITKNALTFVSFDLGSSSVTTAGEILYLEKSKKKGKKNTGEILVETDPPGAIVYLNNDEKGVAPLKLENVPEGEHELAVYLPGFFKRTRKIMVMKGYTLNAFFKLAIDKSQQEKLKEIKEKTATDSAENEKQQETKNKNEKVYVTIKNTPTGWLRVREKPSLSASESAKVKIGAKFEFLEEEKGWYKIKFNGNKEDLVSGSFEEGWISSRYAEKMINE